jgi:hypothetical protein
MFLPLVAGLIIGISLSVNRPDIPAEELQQKCNAAKTSDKPEYARACKALHTRQATAGRIEARKLGLKLK